MKLMIIICAALFASTAVADHLPRHALGTYETEGTWIDIAGDEGRWSSTLTFTLEEPADGKEQFVLYKDSMIVHHGDESYELEETLELHLKDAGFFDVVFEDAVIGEGYCYEGHCHLSYGLADTKINESFFFNDDGSRVLRNGAQVREHYRTAWKGIGTKN